MVIRPVEALKGSHFTCATGHRGFPKQLKYTMRCRRCQEWVAKFLSGVASQGDAGVRARRGLLASINCDSGLMDHAWIGQSFPHLSPVPHNAAFASSVRYSPRTRSVPGAYDSVQRSMVGVNPRALSIEVECRLQPPERDINLGVSQCAAASPAPCTNS